MGGSARVESALGVGTTVYWYAHRLGSTAADSDRDVWLEPANAPVVNREEILDEIALRRMPNVQLNILLAEDNAMNQAVILQMLKAYDCQVRLLFNH